MMGTVRGTRSEAGFTLLELLVSLSLTALALALIVSIVVVQARAAVRMEGTVRQLEQVRLSADLLSGEIADLPRGAVLSARSDSLSYRLPIAWGVLCGEISRAEFDAKKKPKKPKKGDPLPPEYDPNAAMYFEPMASSMGSPTPEGFAVSLDGVEWTYYPVASWSGLGLVAEARAQSACLDSLPTKKPSGKKTAPLPPGFSFFKFPNYSVVTNAQPPEQGIFAAYVKASYYFTQQDDGTLILNRALGQTVQQVARPLAANATFRYRLADGSEVATVSAIDLDKIRAIQARLPARKPPDPRFKSDSLEIAPWMPLYNSR